MPTSGSIAPDFDLPDQDGNRVALRALRGRWVVLYFYPKDDTPGCTVEACEFTAALPDFRGLSAEVLGCSADSASSHAKFIAKHKLGIRLLTDADRSVMKRYGAFGTKVMYGKKVEGVIRSTVLIAPDGTVAHHWPTVKAQGHAEQVRQRLAELQGGLAQPAGAAPAPAPPRRAARKTAVKAAGKTARKMQKKAGSKAAGKRPARTTSSARKKAKKAKKAKK